MSGYDTQTYFFPIRSYASRVLTGGEIPLWNPYLFMGAPFLANPQAAVFYPLNLLLMPLDAARAVSLSVVIHVWLAAAGALVFARRVLNLGWIPSTTAALAFGLGGMLSGQTGHPKSACRDRMAAACALDGVADRDLPGRLAGARSWPDSELADTGRPSTAAIHVDCILHGLPDIRLARPPSGGRVMELERRSAAGRSVRGGAGLGSGDGGGADIAEPALVFALDQIGRSCALRGRLFLADAQRSRSGSAAELYTLAVVAGVPRVCGFSRQSGWRLWPLFAPVRRRFAFFFAALALVCVLLSVGAGKRRYFGWRTGSCRASIFFGFPLAGYWDSIFRWRFWPEWDWTIC